MRKIFITGITGSGKSYFAKKYAIENNLKYIDFDNNWSYSTDQIKMYNSFIKILNGDFVLDAIPYSRDENENLLFLEYYNKNENDIKIICTYCSERDEFLNRIKMKNYSKADKENVLLYAKNFYYDTILEYSKNMNIVYYDTSIFSDKKIHNRDYLLEKIMWLK
jgi:broad-specificity NMP kinase